MANLINNSGRQCRCTPYLENSYAFFIAGCENVDQGIYRRVQQTPLRNIADEFAKSMSVRYINAVPQKFINSFLYISPNHTGQFIVGLYVCRSREQHLPPLATGIP